MLIHHRPFDASQGDFEKMWRFLQQDYADRGDNFIWCFARLGDWKYGLWNEKKYIPTFFRDHAHLWVDGFDRLLGFVLSEDGANIFFIFTAREYAYLYDEILDWTIAHWGARFPTLVIEVHENQSEALAALESRGFRDRGLVATTRIYDVAVKAREPVHLPEGYSIVDMADHGDYAAKAQIYLDGFSGEDQVTEFDLARFAYSRESPAYDPRFDFSVVTPTGAHVATCVGFNDPGCGMAEIEKVCTHNGYRRQGLAQSVIRECFHRLHGRGIARAYITGYSDEANALYERLGPCGHKRWFHYALETADRLE